MDAGAIHGQFALDLAGLERLKQRAAEDPRQGMREAAEQFEALFLNQVLKSMRDATPRSGLVDSQQLRFHESLFDQQLSQHMAGQGLGLADALIRELEGGPATGGGQ